MRRGLAAALALLAWAQLAAAAGSADALGDAAERIARTEAGLTAAGHAPDRVAALAAAIAGYEDALAAMRGVVVGAAARQRAITLDLAARRDEVMRLAAALQAMSRTPPPAPALHPQGPLAAARARAMLARVTPALGDEAATLAAGLADLEAARRTRDQGMHYLAGGLRTLAGAREELRLAIAEADRAPPADLPSAALLRDSDTLSALAEALADAGGGATAAAGVPQGRLAWPVAGQVLRRFNERDAARVRRPGLTIAAPPLALVTAPAEAEVRYAGPFLDYGYVVVLEPGADTLVVLAGLAQLNVRAGAQVARGALIGLLGGRALDAEEYVILPHASTGAGGPETLYIEIRHGAGPVDPEPWFASGNGWEYAR